MKKSKFLKSKFCILPTFVLGAFGSLVLAACEPIKTIPTTPSSSVEPETSLILKESPSENAELEANSETDIESNVEVEIKVRAKASEEQKNAVAKIIQQQSFSTYLDVTIQEKEALLKNIPKLIFSSIKETSSLGDGNSSLSEQLKSHITTFETAINNYVAKNSKDDSSSKLNVVIKALENLEIETNKLVKQFENEFKDKTFLNSIFVKLKNELKTLSFFEALKFEEEDAINLFALHVKEPVHLDVTQLNHHLTQEQKSFKKIWTVNDLRSAFNSSLNLKKALTDLVDKNSGFKIDFVSDKNHESRIVGLLKGALKIPNIKEEDKVVINNFLLEFNKLSPSFDKLYNSFFDVESNTSVLGLANQLIKFFDNVDATISGVQDLGSFLEIMAKVQNLKNVVQNFKNILPESQPNSKVNPTWLNDLIEVHSKLWSSNGILKWDTHSHSLIETDTKPIIDDTTNFESAFKSLGEYHFTLTELAAQMLRILKINTNGARQGLLKDALFVLDKTTVWFSYNSNESLISQLDELINLAANTLDFIKNSDTMKIMNDLAITYNYGQTNS